MTSIKDTPEHRQAQFALERYAHDYWEKSLRPIREEIRALRTEVDELKQRLAYPN